jgi:hypothetical protein
MPRDLEYEINNIEYDEGYNSERIKCKNYELCKDNIPLDGYNYKGNYLCINCDNFEWNELEFRDATEECIVCFCNNSREMKFPTNCDHWFCINCSKDILFWNETRYHLSPEPYGCLPCPNGCINPLKGKQCYCEEYNIIQDNWELNEPEQYIRWNNDEHESIELSEETSGSVYCSKTCPLCRKKYDK